MTDNSILKISIVTPSLNQGRFLEEAICSVLDQGYRNLEYIIIDGGSSDESVAIIKKYEKHLSYWCSKPDGGHYAAVNEGFSHATGDIFAWLNSDDMYCPWALKTIGSIFGTLNDVDWLTTLYPLIWDKQGYCQEAGNVLGYSEEAFMDGLNLPWEGPWTIQQESTFWRRRLWDQVGGLNLDYSLAGDFDLWARFYSRSDLYGIRSPLGGFRKHDNQRSLQVSQYREEARCSLMAIRENLGLNGKIRTPKKIRKKFENVYLRTIAAVYRRLRARKYMGPQVKRKLQREGNEWVTETSSFHF